MKTQSQGGEIFISASLAGLPLHGCQWSDGPGDWGDRGRERRQRRPSTPGWGEWGDCSPFQWVQQAASPSLAKPCAVAEKSHTGWSPAASEQIPALSCPGCMGASGHVAPSSDTRGHSRLAVKGRLTRRPPPLLTRFRSDSAAAFSSANTTLLLLALFLDRLSLTSGSVLPGQIGNSCSTFGVLGGATSRSKLKGERDSSRSHS